MSSDQRRRRSSGNNSVEGVETSLLPCRPSSRCELAVCWWPSWQRLPNASVNMGTTPLRQWQLLERKLYKGFARKPGKFFHNNSRPLSRKAEDFGLKQCTDGLIPVPALLRSEGSQALMTNKLCWQQTTWLLSKEILQIMKLLSVTTTTIIKKLNKQKKTWSSCFFSLWRQQCHTGLESVPLEVGISWKPTVFP